MLIPPEALTPLLTGAFAVVTGIIAGIMARRNAKMGARESRAPDVEDLWARQELDRQTRFKLEERLMRALRTFRAYVDRVQRGGSSDLTEHERDVLANRD